MEVPLNDVWRVWSTATPDSVDLSSADNPPDSPEAAVRAACAWNLRADGGSWFGGGVAALGVEAADGRRWTCAVWLVAATGDLSLATMVPANVWTPRHGGGATLTIGGVDVVEIEPLGPGWWVSAGHAGSDGVNGTLQEAKVRALELLSGIGDV